MTVPAAVPRLPRALGVLLTAAGLLAGCGRGAPPPPPADAPVVGHEHHAPHGGTLVEIGEEFAHLEMLFDQQDGRVTVYVLNGEAEEPIRLPDTSLMLVFTEPKSLSTQPLAADAVASTLTGETVGDTSEFVVTRPELTHTGEVSGMVPQVTIRGQTFKDLPFKVPAAPAR